MLNKIIKDIIKIKIFKFYYFYSNNLENNIFIHFHLYRDYFKYFILELYKNTLRLTNKYIKIFLYYLF